MSDPLGELREKVALACRILAMEELIEGILGHVSARVPGADEMLIRCRGDHEDGVRYTRVDAVRRVDFDGAGSELGEAYQVPKELPIHGEIYKRRPQVGSVIHAHPPDALICGIADIELRPVFGAFNIPAMRLALEGIPVFPRSALVTRPELAAPMIEIMGERPVCLMKGHGITVTGETVEQATIRALSFDVLARTALRLAQTGRTAPDISPEDVAELPDLGSTFNDVWIWRAYVRKLEEADRR